MNKVSVNILGRTYDVEVAPGDELLIYSLAEYVEQKLARSTKGHRHRGHSETGDLGRAEYRR